MRVQGPVRWPFGPPHLTLKPFKRKTKIPKKGAFQLSDKSSFWGGSKNWLLRTWPNKRAPKNTIKIEVSTNHFWKQLTVTKRPLLDKIQKFQLSFSLWTTKTQKCFFKNAILRKLPNIWAPKTHNDNWVCKKPLQTTIEIGLKSPWTR